MSTDIALKESALTKLILKGDLASLSEEEKITYYKTFCERLGLDWTTKPFAYLVLNGKTVLYCGKDGCEQLNKVHKVSSEIRSTERIEDIYIVTARASTDNRFADSTGAVSVKGLFGDALANAYMKAETKAKRRATLSLLGLAMLDETEVATIPDARVEEVGSPKLTIEEEQDRPATKAEMDNLVSFATLNDWTREMMSDHCIKVYGPDYKKNITKGMIGEIKTCIIEWAVEKEVVTA